MEIKTYTIGGKQFQLRPLTQRQRLLAAPIERRMREVIYRLADSSAEKNFKAIYDISLDMDSIVFAEDCGFLKFLATILVPADVAKWSVECIEQNFELMWEITEDVQAEVLRDFFGRAMNSPLGSPVSISRSTSAPKLSETSEPPEDSTNRMTS